MMLPNFELEKLPRTTIENSDYFRFEEEDIARVWEKQFDQLITFYKLAFSHSSLSTPFEKIVAFNGHYRVAYISWSWEVHGLYVMSGYRAMGIAKYLLSNLPKGLHITPMPFTLFQDESLEQGLTLKQLDQFYRRYYHDLVPAGVV